MSAYYVNKNSQSNGDHEIHVLGCSYFPKKENAEYLGNFTYCDFAILEAKKKYDQVNGCFYRSKECHTG